MSQHESPVQTLMKLIGDDPDNAIVGYAYQMEYDEATLLVNDYWKKSVYGVPLNAFLVASTIRTKSPDDNTPNDEQEVILLRVTGEFELPTDKDIVKLVIEHYKRKTSIDIESHNDGIDKVTQSDLQWGGLKCRILGTFYVSKDNQLKFGSDLENYTSFSNLRVYKPMGSALEKIVNYCDPARKERMNKEARKLGFQEAPPDVKVGSIRYTSTQRLFEMSDSGDVPVYINSGDFLARRTGCFGMTRTGKSNLIKTLIASVRLAAGTGRVSIGQLIFDLNGEYANANSQDDGTSIAEVFHNETVRYRGIATPDFKDLRNNFYTALTPGLATLQGLLNSDKLNSSADIRNFIEMSLDEPETIEHNEHNRWKLRRAIYLAILHKAGFESSSNFRVKFSVSETILDSIIKKLVPPAPKDEQEQSLDLGIKEEILPEGWVDPNAKDGITLDEAVEWFTLARKADQKARKDSGDGGIRSSTGNLWLDGVTRSLLNLLTQKSDMDNYIRGMKALTRFAQYHSLHGSEDVAFDIYNELEKGKIVILDLSVGVPSIRQDMAERIAKRIFDVSMGKFTVGEDPPHIVMYVEEAHNLIGKNSELDQTWPRIAKEGAKFKMALVYATQEPSSVHPNILSNTENLFITHLNNDDEILSIGKYYDFADFGKSLKKAQDIGFARIKTLSASFVVPTQVKLFDPHDIKKTLRAMTPAKSSSYPTSLSKKTMPSLSSKPQIQTREETSVTEGLRELDKLGTNK